jgi:hypothetical protein
MKQYNDKALDSLMTTNREQVQEFNTTSLGYWAAHEQYSMHDLLRFVVEEFGKKVLPYFQEQIKKNR